jgi:two-component system response regulator HydG
VLVIDRDAAVARAVASHLGDEVDIEWSAPDAATERLVGQAFDVAIVDPVGHDLSEVAGHVTDHGLLFLRRLRKAAPELGLLVFTEAPTVASTVTAMRVGAYDVLRTGCDGRTLRAAVQRAANHGALTREVRRLRVEVERARGLGEIVGRSPLMRDLLAMVERVAASDATVLVLGESGTGKELLARTLHRVGRRAEGPFVAFDCSALTPSLLEAELFGHEKGAFTGAGRARRGLFREAQGGTIFLDEIGDIAPSVQNKLLRVLQEREIKPVGGDRFVPIDVRVVAATNKDLRELIGRGMFREDLYWRLAVVPLHVPPLRERKEDIPALAAHILSRRGAGRAPALTPGALARLMDYHWPGNIRELENVLSRAAILCDGERVRSDDLELVGLVGGAGGGRASGGGAAAPAPVAANAAPASGRRVPLKVQLQRAVREVERAALAAALERHDGSATLAARELGISRASMYNKIREHGLRLLGAAEEE